MRSEVSTISMMTGTFSTISQNVGLIRRVCRPAPISPLYTVQPAIP